MANANIDTIDYDALISGASNIASNANIIQNNIQAAFQLIDSMREHWFGNSYDNFIDVVNMSITSLNKIFETTVSDIPHEIAAKAKSYAAANQSSCSVALNEQTAIILSEVSRTNKGSQLRFQADSVLLDQAMINGKFKEAENTATNAYDLAESIKPVWMSISGDTNITELKAAFNSLKTIINRLYTALDNQITSQANTINTLESAASAVEAAGQIKEDAITEVETTAQNWKQEIEEGAAQTWKNLTGKN